MVIKKEQSALETEVEETLELMRQGIEQGLVTLEEYETIRSLYDIRMRESAILRAYEEKYGMLDELNLNDDLDNDHNYGWQL